MDQSTIDADLVVLRINHSVDGVTPRVSLPVDLQVVVLHVDDGLGVVELQLPGEPPQLSPAVLGSPGDVLGDVKSCSE